jgi:hypothetical protein
MTGAMFYVCVSHIVVSLIFGSSERSEPSQWGASVVQQLCGSKCLGRACSSAREAFDSRHSVPRSLPGGSSIRTSRTAGQSSVEVKSPYSVILLCGRCSRRELLARVLAWR